MLIYNYENMFGTLGFFRRLGPSKTVFVEKTHLRFSRRFPELIRGWRLNKKSFFNNNFIEFFVMFGYEPDSYLAEQKQV